MKKLLKWAGIAVVVLVVAVALFYLFGLDALIRRGVEKGGAYATGQTTSLDGAKLSLTGGALQLTGLGISNPPGYKAQKFLALKDCRVAVQTGTLTSSTVVVDEIAIDGLDLTIEQNGLKSNLGEILDVIQKQTSAGSATGNSGGASAPGKQLKIGLIKLTGTKVHIKSGVDINLDLGDFEIKEPTNPDGRPMKIADVVGQVLIRVAQQIANNPQVPGGFKNGLENVNKLVGGLDKNLGSLKDLGKGLGDMFKKK